MSDHTDDEFADSKKLSTLYHAGNTAQPPAHIDQAILAKARCSVRPMPQRTHSLWAVPLSVAAILVLSVSLISLIHKEAPTVSDIPIDTPFSNDSITTAGITKNDMLEKQNNETITEKEIPAKSSIAMAHKEKAISETEISDHLASPEYPPAYIGEAIKVPPSESDVEQKLTPESFQRADPQPGTTNTDTEFYSRLKKDHYSEKNKHCELLHHSACLDSTKCSLVMDAQKTLVCHRSIDHCDNGFSQKSDTKESCEAKNGCMYISKPCACAPDVVCVCDKNQLPQCKPLDTSDAEITSQPISTSHRFRHAKEHARSLSYILSFFGHRYFSVV